MSAGQFLNDRAKAQLNGAWRQGPRITVENVKNGTGAIEHITADEFFGRTGKATGQTGGQQSPKGAAQQRHSAIFHFGKHRGKLMSDVRDADPGYWSWCCREVAGFEAKAKKAGLLDE